MTTTYDGGPAFPGHHNGDDYWADERTARLDEIEDHKPVAWRGMSLRDYFAGQALMALAGHFPSGGPDGPTAEQRTAEAAYQYADAMLAERSK